jgi:hypothetical protein
MCSYMCDATHKACPTGSLTCIASAACCTSVDCPATSPICNATTHACGKRPDGDACSTQGECASGVCQVCYPDADGDGFSNKWISVPTGLFCGICPLGSSADHRDCLDNPADPNASVVNPNAEFHFSTYAPDPADTTPDGWDWNCNDVQDLSAPPMASGIPVGCTATSSCAAGCVTMTGTVPVPQVCGQTAGGSACANACSIPPQAGPRCMNVSISTVQQTCR